MKTDTMSSIENITLKVDSKKLDAFCKKIVSRSRNTANVHEALTVLEAFVSQFSSDSLASDAYLNIQNCLTSHSEKTRDKLMQEKTAQVREGMITKNRLLLSHVYNSLSRNGFYQILTEATHLINNSDIPEIAQWVIQWSTQAKQKAEQASGYPDALDFTKAKINIEQYQCMSDISYFFKNTYQSK